MTDQNCQCSDINCRNKRKQNKLTDDNSFNLVSIINSAPFSLINFRPEIATRHHRKRVNHHSPPHPFYHDLNSDFLTSSTCLFAGVFYAVFFALVASSLAAEKKEKAAEEDGRFFLTGTGNNSNTSITVSSDVIYLLAVVAFGLIAAAIVAAIVGVGVGSSTGDYSYSAPT